MLHPIKRFRAMRRRSKVAFGGVFAVLLAGGVALAAILLTTSAPFTGSSHNGSWSAAVTAAALVPDTGTIGSDAPGTIYEPQDGTNALTTALGCTQASGCTVKNDSSEHYLCQNVTFVPGDATNQPGFTFSNGSGALPGDTCYIDVTVHMPATNAADTYFGGIDVTGLPSGWTAFIDGEAGGPSLCTAPQNPLAQAGSVSTVHIPVAIVAGANANTADNSVYAVTGHLNFVGSRTAPTNITEAACEVVAP